MTEKEMDGNIREVTECNRAHRGRTAITARRNVDESCVVVVVRVRPEIGKMSQHDVLRS